MEGWIKLHRKVLNNPFVLKDAEHLAVWVYILLNAAHDDYPALFKGEKIMLRPGQLLTGCIAISTALNVSESKVRRILKTFESDGQIERQTSNKNSLITVLKWDIYQKTDMQTDGQLTDKWRATDGQVTTNKNNKNVKNKRNNNSAPASTESKQDINSFFEDIWKLYPNKKGKGQVSDAAKKRLYKIGKEEITSAIDRYVDGLKQEEWRKVQNGSTFFNSGYVDYLDANYAPPKDIKRHTKNQFNNYQQSTNTETISELEQLFMQETNRNNGGL